MPWKESWPLKVRRRLRKPYNQIFRRDYFVTRYLGSKFLLRPGGIGTLEISAGICERPELLHFIDRCKRIRPSLFIDIGANIGMYSCILLRNGYVPRALLFEPDVRNRAHLGANLMMNELLELAEVRPVALGDRKTCLHLLPGRDDGGFSRVVNQPEAGSYEVAVERLDDQCALTGQTLAIKIDVEEYEGPVIAGMRRSLTENNCLVQIESFQPEPIITEMRRLGYSMTKDFLPNFVFERAG